MPEALKNGISPTSDQSFLNFEQNNFKNKTIII